MHIKSVIYITWTIYTIDCKKLMTVQSPGICQKSVIVIFRKKVKALVFSTCCKQEVDKKKILDFKSLNIQI